MENFKRYLCGIALLSLFLFFAGCASVPKVQVPFRAGAQVESFASAVSISVKAPQGSGGGRGYMLFRRPDSFHLVVLTPFGTTAMETFGAGGRLTILIPSKGVAFTGSFDDIPAESPLRGWRMIRLMASDVPFYDPSRSGTSQKISGALGEITCHYNASGLLERELFQSGDEVSFKNYLSADGVPFPGVIELADRGGARVKVTFDEPEVNGTLDDAALSPNLEGITLLPLASFRGV